MADIVPIHVGSGGGRSDRDDGGTGGRSSSVAPSRRHAAANHGGGGSAEPAPSQPALPAGMEYAPGIGPRSYSLGRSSLPLPGEGGARGVGVNATYRSAAPLSAYTATSSSSSAAAERDRERYGNGNTYSDMPASSSSSSMQYQQNNNNNNYQTSAFSSNSHNSNTYAAELAAQIAETDARKRAARVEQATYERSKLNEQAQLPGYNVMHRLSRPSIRLAGSMGSAPISALAANWEATRGGGGGGDQPYVPSAPSADYGGYGGGVGGGGGVWTRNAVYSCCSSCSIPLTYP